MAITGIGSWRPTMNEFGQHWPKVNTALAPNVLRLTAGYALANFLADEQALNDAIDAVGPLIIEAAILSAQRTTLKEALRKRATQYRLSVNGLLAGSTFASQAPEAPDASSGFEVFFKPLNKIKQDWGIINALDPTTAPDYGVESFDPPMTLTGLYTLAQFSQQMEQLEILWPKVEEKEREATFARKTRDVLVEKMRTRLVQYRNAVPGQLADNSALLATLPRYSPPPGNKPDSAEATGQWEDAIGKAKFIWPAASDPRIDHFSVRMVPGPVYHADDEITLADLPKTATSFETESGLSVEGAIANFKIYTVGSDGNENGGKAIEIIRPVT